jgi:hypothetical protein
VWKIDGTPAGKNYFENLGIDGGIILNWMLEE